MFEKIFYYFFHFLVEFVLDNKKFVLKTHTHTRARTNNSLAKISCARVMGRSLLTKRAKYFHIQYTYVYTIINMYIIMTRECVHVVVVVVRFLWGCRRPGGYKSRRLCERRPSLD